MNYSINYTKMVNNKYSCCFTLMARNAPTGAIGSYSNMYAKFRDWVSILNNIDNANHTDSRASYSGFMQLPSDRTDNTTGKADVSAVIYSENGAEPKTTTIRIKDTDINNVASAISTAYTNATGQSIGDINDYLVNVIVVFHS